MVKSEKESLLNAQWNIIHECEANLKSTDYIAAKIAEGKATKTEYKDKIEQRQGWRDEINAAQEEIARIEAIEVEPDENEAKDK